jgi:hypothetical protein
MSLLSLVDNNETDKNTSHSYLELYETLLAPKKDTAKNILEIGIGDYRVKNGGSIKLWKSYFTNAKIYALVIEDVQSIDWWPILYREVPQHLKKFVKPYDLRKNKNRYDDLVFTIDKSSLST